MRLGFDPRRRYLTGPPPGSPSYVYRKRRLLAGFDPRVRYLRGLRGLGDDTPSLGPYTPITETPDYGVIDTDVQMAETGGGLNPLSSSTGVGPGSPYGTATPVTMTIFSTPSTAASLANRSTAPATTPSWFSQTNPTLGISNGLLAGGVAALAALVLLSGGRRR